MVAAIVHLDQLHPPAGKTLESADLRRVENWHLVTHSLRYLTQPSSKD